MCPRLFVAVILSLGLGCSNSQVVRSKDLSLEQRILELGKAISLKSDVLDTEFVLYDANRSSSVPGASNKDYKVFIRVRSAEVHKWTDGKDNWLTSFPKDHSWLPELVRDPVIPAEFESAGYRTYFKASDGYEYTIWASSQTGIVLLRYVQN